VVVGRRPAFDEWLRLRFDLPPTTMKTREIKRVLRHACKPRQQSFCPPYCRARRTINLHFVSDDSRARPRGAAGGPTVVNAGSGPRSMALTGSEPASSASRHRARSVASLVSVQRLEHREHVDTACHGMPAIAIPLDRGVPPYGDGAPSWAAIAFSARRSVSA